MVNFSLIKIPHATKQKKSRISYTFATRTSIKSSVETYYNNKFDVNAIYLKPINGTVEIFSHMRGSDQEVSRKSILGS